jgi:hypothetical protein
MPLSDQTKILIVVILVLVIILFLYQYSRENMEVVSSEKNSRSESRSESKLFTDSELMELQEGQNELSDIPKDSPSVMGELDQESAKLKKKMVGKNSAKSGEYKRFNYVGGKRDKRSNEFDDYVDESNKAIKDVYQTATEFNALDNTQTLAPYMKSDKYKVEDEEDIFKAEDYLPKEKKDDWFEVMPEAISVKNRHLINVTRPVGVNTIGTTLKNPSYDIRGNPPCPKFVVSPWMQSSYEPDTNIKGLC